MDFESRIISINQIDLKPKDSSTQPNFSPRKNQSLYHFILKFIHLHSERRKTSTILYVYKSSFKRKTLIELRLPNVML